MEMMKTANGYCMSFYMGYKVGCIVEISTCGLVSSSLVSFGLACENEGEFG